MHHFYYAYTIPPPPNPTIPTGAPPPTDLIKFGRSRMERHFDSGGRYADVRRKLEPLCGQLLLSGLNVPNHQQVPEFQAAVRMCVKYHFRMIASVGCKATGACIDLLWRCGIQRINALNNHPYRVVHNPQVNPVVPFVSSGASEFYSVVNQQGNPLSADIGFRVLDETLRQTL